MLFRSVDLNRPDEGNAMTRGMMVQLADTLREVGSDSGVKVVALVSRPRLVLETIKLSIEGRAPDARHGFEIRRHFACARPLAGGGFAPASN